MERAIASVSASEPATGSEGIWSGLEELRAGLRAYLGRQCADEHELDDAVQETLLRAARYRGVCEVHCLRGWVLRIGRNVLADGRRRRFRGGLAALGEEELEELAQPPAGSDGGMRCAGGWFEREEARTLVERGLARLGHQDHALLWGVYGRSLALKGAASAAGVPAHLARVRLYRARRKLRAAVTREVSMQRHLGLAS